MLTEFRRINKMLSNTFFLSRGDMNRNVLLGIGNRLRSDDGAGSHLAEMFSFPGWLSVDGDIMPENFTGIIKKENPELLIIVDACSMDERPGSFRRIPLSHLSSEYGFNTHNASVKTLIEYLHQFVKEIVFIGIQPETTAFGEELSIVVKNVLPQIADILKKNAWKDIPEKE